MQISNAASSPTLTQPVQTGTGAASKATTADTGAAASTSPASPSQNAAVNISPEGTATLAGDGSNAATAANTGTTSTNDTSDKSSTDDPGNDDSLSTSTTNVSPLKSFAYGSLGLERPDQTQQETNSFYTAGRWLAAGITIGGLISLFV